MVKKPASKKKPGAVDLAAIVAGAKERIADPAFDYTMWEELVALMKPGKAAVKSAEPKLQREFWELYAQVTSAGDVRETPDAVRSLIALEANAPASQRAVRLANLAVAENVVNRKDGYKTFQQALTLAPDDDTRASVLMQWLAVKHDLLTPAVANCDLYDLARKGALSKETASAALERVAHSWPLLSNAKAQKAVEKLLASRKLDRNAMVLDACERWLALNDKPSQTMVLIVSTLIEQLFNAERSKEGFATFKKWTPMFDKAFKSGAIDDSTLKESWYGSHATTLSLSGFEKEAKKAQKAYDNFDDNFDNYK